MRAKNIQTLTDQLKAKFKGVTIYGIGDAAHKLRISDHNEDDTPGVRAEQSDSDNIPEHRAIDVMVGPSFTRTDAVELVGELVNNSSNQKRLHYVIWDGGIWSQKTNWVRHDYDGENKHRDHPHVSGLASDDDNTTPWVLSASPVPHDDDKLDVDGELGPKTISKWQKVMGTWVDGKISENSQLIRKVQQRLHDTVDHRLVVDGDGNSLDAGVFRHTVAALQRYLKSPVDGVISTPKSEVVKALQRRLNENRF